MHKQYECKNIISFLIIFVLFAIVAMGMVGCADTQETDIVCQSQTISSGLYQVDSEITLPKDGDSLPSVIIVPGSGNMDMDGTVGMQKPYKDLAYQLAKKGIASIRFNKITYQHAEKLESATDFTVDDEYFYAIRSCVDILRQTERINSGKIFLLGHSLGAQMIAEYLKHDNSLAGGIIMAGTTAHILDLLMEQTAKQNQTLYQEYLPYYQKARSLNSVPMGEENYYYFGAYSAYWVSYNELDRLAVTQVACPLLVMQGGLDLQVTTEHFNVYKSHLAERDNVVFKEYAELNHLFSDGKGETVQTAYMRTGKIPTEVIDDIAHFVLK